MIDSEVAQGRRRDAMRPIKHSLLHYEKVWSLSYCYFEVSDPDDTTFSFLKQSLGIGVQASNKRAVQQLLEQQTGMEPAVVELANPNYLPFISIVSSSPHIVDVNSSNARQRCPAVLNVRHPGAVVTHPSFLLFVASCLEDGGWVIDGRFGDGGLACEGDVLRVTITFEAGGEDSSSATDSISVRTTETMFWAV